MTDADSTTAPAVNLDVAEHFREAADLLEAQDASPFRVRAYRQGASTLSQLDRSAETIYEQEGREGLEDLPNIGASLTNAIVEMLETGGQWRFLERLEGTVTPEGLFAKLDDWGFDSIVIPHSGAWGFHNPPLHNWVHQLNATHHDPERELMIEIYSGHGNSEQWRPFVPFVRVSEDETICPEAAPDYEPCCRRAGEAILTRDPACIDDPDSPACAAAVDAARQAWIEASFDGRYLFDKDWPDRPLTDDELGDCGQCRDCDFNPAFSYTPNGTVQATLALANVDETDADGDPLRYRFGLIGSTDEHQGKPGVGYKEAKRFSDIFGPVDASLEPLSGTIDATAADWERQGSFWFGGGRIAVHSDSRSREDIWDALKTKRVYATSGRNILLWFDAVVAGASDPVFMGETLRARTSPTFRVKAVGDWVQEPGCPEEVHEAMGDAFVEDICLGECYNPGTERFPIDRIEVVRIRPQVTGDEPLGDLIDDPWRVLPCDGSTEGCEVTFTDPDFAASGRSALYYVRAIHPEEPVLNGGQLRCRGIEGTRCTEIRPCEPGYRGEGDDCLAPAQHRAWSSPIFVDWDA